MLDRSEGRRNWPFGLFLLLQTLASFALAAIPAEMVILVFCSTSARICATASSGSMSCSLQYSVIFRYASSILADSNRGSYCSRTALTSFAFAKASQSTSSARFNPFQLTLLRQDTLDLDHFLLIDAILTGLGE
ncbi:hypothetical protein KC325_g162 [Hortaea werneckii]|nr:hypothetical protein KC325_g162 [Hortaea werneckii]